MKQNRAFTGTLFEQGKAIEKGWINQRGNLWEILPGISLYEEHKNRKKKTPRPNKGGLGTRPILTIMEDIRNTQRLLFSDDGLIFVTYDHYQTYFEII